MAYLVLQKHKHGLYKLHVAQKNGPYNVTFKNHAMCNESQVIDRLAGQSRRYDGSNSNGFFE